MANARAKEAVAWPPSTATRSTRPLVVVVRVALLLLAVVLYVAPMPWSFHFWESHTWINMGHDVFTGRNPYEVGVELSGRVSGRALEVPGWAQYYEYIAYPPLWLIIMYPFYLIVAPETVPFLTQGGIPDAVSPLAAFALKVPIVVFAFAMAWVLFRIAQVMGMRNPWTIVWIWLFNPLAWLVSAVWGHFDVIAVFFTAAALLAVMKGRAGLAGVLLALGVLTKIYPAILAPVLLYAIFQQGGFRDGGFRRSVAFCATFAATILLVSAPFIAMNAPAFLQSASFHGDRVGGGMTYYNVVWLAKLEWGRPYLEFGLNFSKMYLPIMLWALWMAYVWMLGIDVTRPRNLLIACGVVLFAFLATTKLVNEPYALWVLPFLLLLAMGGNRRIAVLAVLVTVIPLVFITVNVPLTLLFRPYFSDTPLGMQLTEAVVGRQAMRYYSLFVLGIGFTATCVAGIVVLARNVRRQVA